MPSLDFNKEEAFSTIQKEGLFKVEQFLNDKEVQSLKNELISTFDTMETGEEFSFPDHKESSYPFGKICRVSSGYLNSFPNILASFNHTELHALTDKYFNKPHQKLFQVFFSHEYLTPDQADGATRNSFLHVDPYHAFKFMIYLTDCDENSGAFRYIKGSHIDGQEAREGHSVEGLMGDKYRLDENPDLFNKYSEDDVVYASGKSGDLLVFTTDIIHGGGIVKKEGLERIGIICHNR